MTYSDAQQHTTELADMAYDHMKERGIPANPHNFTIWYEYFSGDNISLSKSLNVLLTNDQEFTELRNEEIYDEFFASERPSAQVQAWGERIETVAGKILAALAESGSGTEQYGKTLENFSGKIEGVSDADEIRKMVAGIVTETKAMESQVARLQSDVATSTEEITTLRVNLETARRDAMTDGLTGLANRKCFDEKLTEAAVDAVENGEPLSLVFADLDYFKKFNDMHGHQIGDQVLRLVGRMLIQSIKGQDTAARYGGEEFVLLLPNTDIRGAAAVADKIRQKVGAKRLVKKGSDDDYGVITLSMGVTEFAPGETLANFVRRADAALYTAKGLGRNRVVSEEPRPQPVIEDA